MVAANNFARGKLLKIQPETSNRKMVQSLKITMCQSCASISSAYVFVNIYKYISHTYIIYIFYIYIYIGVAQSFIIIHISLVAYRQCIHIAGSGLKFL